jgi:hypothetical protein
MADSVQVRRLAHGGGEGRAGGGEGRAGGQVAVGAAAAAVAAGSGGGLSWWVGLA